MMNQRSASIATKVSTPRTQVGALKLRLIRLALLMVSLMLLPLALVAEEAPGEALNPSKEDADEEADDGSGAPRLLNQEETNQQSPTSEEGEDAPAAAPDAAPALSEEEAEAEEHLEVFAIEDFNDDLAVVHGNHIKLNETILFRYNKTEIRVESEPVLNRVADLLKSLPEIESVRVEGHTDSHGPDKFNLELSEARAEVVVDYLVARGVDRERMTPEGFGESQPIATNKTKEGLQANRRVEFVFIGAERFEQTDRDRAQAELVRARGEVWERTSREEGRLLERWDQVKQGTAFEVGSDAFATLRFQDLGVLVAGARTRLKFVRLEWEPEEEIRRLGIKLLRGAIQLRDPEESEAVIFTVEGSVTLKGAEALMVRSGGVTKLALYRGTGELRDGSQSLALSAGAHYLLDADGARWAGELAEPPEDIRPALGTLWPDATLAWDHDDLGQDRFYIELAHDPSFVEPLLSAAVEGRQWTLPALPDLKEGDTLYLKIRAIREKVPGKEGKTLSFAWAKAAPEEKEEREEKSNLTPREEDETLSRDLKETPTSTR